MSIKMKIGFGEAATAEALNFVRMYIMNISLIAFQLFSNVTASLGKKTLISLELKNMRYS